MEARPHALANCARLTSNSKTNVPPARQPLRRHASCRTRRSPRHEQFPRASARHSRRRHPHTHRGPSKPIPTSSNASTRPSSSTPLRSTTNLSTLPPPPKTATALSPNTTRTTTSDSPKPSGTFSSKNHPAASNRSSTFTASSSPASGSCAPVKSKPTS
jgi:hypothetical protein